MKDDAPDRVDQVLREHGRAWADGFVEPKRAAIDAPSIERRARGWLRPSAAAAAVFGVAAAIVGVVVILSSRPVPESAAIPPGPSSETAARSESTSAGSLPTPTAVPSVVTPGATAEVPTTIEHNGTTLELRSRTSLVQVVLDGADPGLLWVSAGQTTGGHQLNDGTGCVPLVRYTVTEQSADQVVIVAGQYVAKAEPTENQACVLLLHPPYREAVKLDSPLDGRRVVDGASHATADVLDATQFPAPTYLPAGYVAAGFNRGPGSATRTYIDGDKSLEIAWSDSTFELSDTSEELSRPDVNGATAIVWKDKGFDDATLISWAPEPGRLITIQSNAAEHETLSVEELTRVARSLPEGDPLRPSTSAATTTIPTSFGPTTAPVIMVGRVAISGYSVDPTDARRLRLQVFEPESCNLDLRAYLVGEDDDQVRVAAYSYLHVADHGPCTTASTTSGAALEVELAAPLEHRVVVDENGAVGTVPFLDASTTSSPTTGGTPTG